MKNLSNILICFIFLACFHSLQAQTIDKLDQKNGFKDISFGANIAEFSHKFQLTKDGGNDGYSIYESTSYDKIGFIDISKVSLLVYKNRVHEVRITTALENYDDVMIVLKKAYGEPPEEACQELENSEEKIIRYCVWNGSIAMLWCTYFESPEDKQVTIGIKNKALVKQMRNELEARAVDDL